MTDNTSSQNIELSSWDILYIMYSVVLEFILFYFHYLSQIRRQESYLSIAFTTICYYYKICHQLYARYVKLYTSNNPCLYTIQCCSCSVFTVCATCNVIPTVQFVPYRYVSTSRSVCAVHNMAVVRSSLISFIIIIIIITIPVTTFT